MDILRLLRPLGALTMAGLLLAVMAVLGERGVNQIGDAEKLLPAYGNNLTAAKQLKIVHGRGLSGVQGLNIRRGENGWLLSERSNYPANDELVTETLLALADIDILEARTAQADWHRALGLVAPEELGKAIRFEVLDGERQSLARILIGKDEKSEAEAVQQVQEFGPVKSRFYVRHEDSAQSWLALGRVPRNPEPAAWIDPSLPRHDPALLTELAFGEGASAFKAVRVGNAWSMGGAARWIDGFQALRPDDVTRADAINFDTARPVTLVYSDGLRITYENVGAATVIWARMRADTAAGAAAEVKAQAARLNARFGGWALRFSAERTPVLLPARRDLDGN